ncbi:hypothetical protein FRC01_003152 [Tulasnella sp. 417]|nr:hypothetical protein FRC01_003152 [Tulasnella sp. 417]
MYRKANDCRKFSDHLQDTEFLRRLQQDLEATSPPHVPRSHHFARDALAGLDRSIQTRESFCQCKVPEDLDSVGDPDSDPEDGTYCGLEDITEYDYMLELEEMQNQKKTHISRKQHRSRSISSSLSAETHTVSQSIHGIELLPIELIYVIISFARPSDQHIPITLSQVNRFFRTLVNSSPLLWTMIDFNYPFALISRYIERSAGAPLEIIANLWTTSGKTQACLALLRPHRHRIHRLRVWEFDAQYWGLDRWVMTQGPSPRSEPGDNFLWCSALCNLENLDLDFSVWPTYRDIVYPSVTKLLKLRLCGPGSPTSLPLFPPQLESLSLGACAVDLFALLNVLRGTPALEHLALSHILITNETERVSTSPIILQHIKRLSFIRCLARGIRSILQRISIPELSVLTIRLKDEVQSIAASPSDQVLYGAGDGLFAQAQPNIQQLDISFFPGNNAFLETMLRRVPGLTHLRIAFASLHDDQLLLLSVGGTSDVSEKRILCPHLTSLTIEDEFNITSSAIRQIAASRHSASIPLKSLTLRGLDGTNVAAHDLQGLDAYGITELIVDVFYADFSGESDEDWGSGSEDEESSEGDWLSGDDIVTCRSRRSPSFE